MVFYLKYRPQKLADLDLAEVRGGLTKALSSKDIPHAFLFAGPRGTGKTSAARIVAKAVNCEKRESLLRGGRMDSSDGGTAGARKLARLKELASEPCNSCHSCLSITAGTNLDVLEIDGASNRGIDDIRSLREKIKLAPLKLRYKVYIIDEAHMLTREAFNALLKTLEEPPKHAIFILCTTEPQKLPQTIISRCLRFNFRKAKLDELVAGLSKIVKAEKLKVEKVALEKIAQAADGSFRDSQKILEQLSFEKAKITAEKVDEILGQVRGAGPEKLLGYLVGKDARGAVLEIGRVVDEGVNLRWYSERLLERLRLGLLAKLGVAVPDDWQGNVKTQNLLKTPKIGEIKNLIEIFSKVALQLKTAIIPQLPLEMGVVEWCTLSSHPELVSGSVQDPKQVLNLGQEQVAHLSAGKAGVVQVEKVEKENPKDFPSKPSKFSKPPKFSPAKRDPAPRDNPSNPSSPSSSSLSFDSLCQKWPQVLDAVGPKNHSIKAFLRATRPKDFDGEYLVLEVFYEFHKTQLESDKCRRVVEECAEAILKTPVRIKCVLGQKPAPKPIENPDLSSLPAGRQVAPSQPSSPSISSSPSLKQSQEEKYHLSLPSQSGGEDDIMKVAEEIFGKTVD